MGDIATIAREAISLAAKATQGPCCVSGSTSVVTDDDAEEGGAPVKAWICAPAREEDAALIAHALTHYGTIAKEVLRLRAALREMDAHVLEWWSQHWSDDTGGEDPRNVYDEPPDFVTPALRRAGLSPYAGTTEIESAIQRAQSHAPAWTREAPKEDGFYWVRIEWSGGPRPPEPEIARFYRDVTNPDGYWDVPGERSPTAHDQYVEHYTVRLEPPT